MAFQPQSVSLGGSSIYNKGFANALPNFMAKGFNFTPANTYAQAYGNATNPFDEAVGQYKNLVTNLPGVPYQGGEWGQGGSGTILADPNSAGFQSYMAGLKGQRADIINNYAQQLAGAGVASGRGGMNLVGPGGQPQNAMSQLQHAGIRDAQSQAAEDFKWTVGARRQDYANWLNQQAQMAQYDRGVRQDYLSAIAQQQAEDRARLGLMDTESQKNVEMAMKLFNQEQQMQQQNLQDKLAMDKYYQQQGDLANWKQQTNLAFNQSPFSGVPGWEQMRLNTVMAGPQVYSSNKYA